MVNERISSVCDSRELQLLTNVKTREIYTNRQQITYMVHAVTNRFSFWTNRLILMTFQHKHCSTLRVCIFFFQIIYIDAINSTIPSGNCFHIFIDFSIFVICFYWFFRSFLHICRFLCYFIIPLFIIPLLLLSLLLFIYLFISSTFFKTIDKYFHLSFKYS